MTKLSPWAWRLAVAAHLSLILLMSLRSGLSPWLLLVAPLLLPLPGMLRRRDYTCAWASMLVVFYCAAYLAAGYAEPARKWAHFAFAAVAALDFSGLVLFVRLGARERFAESAARTARSAGASH